MLYSLLVVELLYRQPDVQDGLDAALVTVGREGVRLHVHGLLRLLSQIALATTQDHLGPDGAKGSLAATPEVLDPGEVRAVRHAHDEWDPGFECPGLHDLGGVDAAVVQLEKVLAAS